MDIKQDFTQNETFTRLYLLNLFIKINKKII